MIQADRLSQNLNTISYPLPVKNLSNYIFATTLIVLSCVVNQSQAQCTWHQELFDSYEYQTPCPDIIPGTVYGSTPANWAVYSGNYALYMNFVNCNGGTGTCAGDTIYRRVFEVCPNMPNRVTAMLTTTFSGLQCDVKILLLDAGGNVLSNTPSIVADYAPLWSTYQAAFISSTPTITFILITNTDGSQGGNDLSMDDFRVENCYSLSLGSDTTICSFETLLLDPGSGFSSYLWNDNSINQTLTAFAPGGGDTTMTYFVQVINSVSCVLISDTISIAFETCDGIAEWNENDNYSIFVDHGSMSMIVHALQFHEGLRCSLYDASGKEIIHSILDMREQRIVLPTLQAGIYFCTISDGKKVVHAKKLMID